MKLKRYVKKICQESTKEMGLELSDALIKNAASLVFIRSGMDEDREADSLSPIERIELIRVCRSTVSMYALVQDNNKKNK